MEGNLFGTHLQSAVQSTRATMDSSSLFASSEGSKANPGKNLKNEKERAMKERVNSKIAIEIDGVKR